MRQTKNQKHTTLPPTEAAAALRLRMHRDVARALFQARSTKGLSQHEVARCANVKQATVSRAENPKAYVGLESLSRIIDALGCEITITIK